MAGNPKQKVKLLYVYKCLYDHSSPANPLSSTQIIEYLNDKGVSAEKRSVRRDISMLREFGNNIVLTYSPRKGYYLVSRELDKTESDILCEMVMTSPFFAKDKARELIEKLRTVSSSKTKFESNVSGGFCSEELYRNYEKLKTAISRKSQINFRYACRVIRDNKVVTEKKRISAIPLKIICQNGKCNLIASSAGNPQTYEIRNMSDIMMIYDKENPDAAVPNGAFFGAMAGIERIVQLKCTSGALDSVFDVFGTDIKLTSCADGKIMITARVVVSDAFYVWLFEHDQDIELFGPLNMRSFLAQRGRTLCEKYSARPNGYFYT